MLVDEGEGAVSMRSGKTAGDSRIRTGNGQLMVRPRSLAALNRRKPTVGRGRVMLASESGPSIYGQAVFLMSASQVKRTSSSTSGERRRQWLLMERYGERGNWELVGEDSN